MFVVLVLCFLLLLKFFIYHRNSLALKSAQIPKHSKYSVVSDINVHIWFSIVLPLPTLQIQVKITGGEKKIPDDVMVNKRKSCCNCGRQGHFSHDCPFITYSGQQISPFVKNYSAEPLQRGSVDVVISRNYFDIVYSAEADQFFHSLSDYTQAVIGVSDEGKEIVCKINGTMEQCNKVKAEIENYVNTRKRKREEPKSKRKRQRVRY